MKIKVSYKLIILLFCIIACGCGKAKDEIKPQYSNKYKKVERPEDQYQYIDNTAEMDRYIKPPILKYKNKTVVLGFIPGSHREYNGKKIYFGPRWVSRFKGEDEFIHNEIKYDEKDDINIEEYGTFNETIDEKDEGTGVLPYIEKEPKR